MPVAWIAMVSAISNRPHAQLSNEAVLVAEIFLNSRLSTHSATIRAPLWVTERFIKNTTSTSPSVSAANIQKQSK